MAKVKNKTKKTQILVGRVWIYYDSLRPPKWLYFHHRAHRESNIFRDQAEIVVSVGVVKGRYE